MKILSAGGGPAGLYASLLLKKADPGREITVVDRNPADATYGWGVVFSDETLDFLQEADPETYTEIAAGFVHWEAIDIHYRGETVRSGGHAFSGLARVRLLNILQRRCAELGVDLRYNTEFDGRALAPEYDLILAGDGLNSGIRSTLPEIFHPSFDVHPTKYIWLGARMALDSFTFIFRETVWGMFQVHAYPFEPDLCTFIVECTEDTWKRAGLDGADERTSLEFCAGVFAPELDGRPLLSNRSAWINFVTLRNETWHHKNIVLLGDSAHTAHFSVGSGTKMAMEDAIALTLALDHSRDLGASLVEYEELRQPLVERTQTAARESSLWFEHTARYARFAPTQFAFSLLTRSKRITYENLKMRDPIFSDGVDRWYAGAAQIGSRPTASIVPPALNSMRLRDTILPNRIAESPPCMDSAREGTPGKVHLVRLAGSALGGVGLVVTEPLAVCAEGRITLGSAGLYHDDHTAAWAEIITFIHSNSPARIAAQLNHAGRRGATQPRRRGTDIPLLEGGWPLLAASPLPYTAVSPTPRAMEQSDMDEVCNAFADSASRADRAGFDLLDLNLAHGYLLAGFLSPLTNQREDEYGGCMDHRLAFPLRVFTAVRNVWPQGKPLIVSLNVTDWTKGGMDLDEALQIAQVLKEQGCDLIHVLSGQTTATASPVYGRIWQAQLSDAVRNEAEIPTMTSGSLTDGDEVNTILAAGRGDLCLLTPLPTSDPRARLVPMVRARIPGIPAAPKR